MKTQFLKIVAFLAIVVLATSCKTTPQRRAEKARQQVDKEAVKRLFDATRKLEMVEDSQNYDGKIAVSDLEFVANKGQFNVSFNEDVSNYVQAARENISGGANNSVQTAMYLGALLQGSFTSPVSAGSLSASNSPPGQATLPNQAETAVNNFLTPPSINVSPTTDERDAVEKGINDKLAERFLEFMANPASNSNGQAIVFGVMEATCQPGQNTRKGYIAELDISLDYARQNKIPVYTKKAKHLVKNFTTGYDEDVGRLIQVPNYYDATNKPNEEGYYTTGVQSHDEIRLDGSPSVVAVLPLMDTRNMALQNNSQSQLEVAEALSAAFAANGKSAAANILSDYVNRQESNIQTRNSLPVATTFSDSSDFGIQLYPSVQAIEHPGKKGSSAADVLEPVTFPIVVALKVDKDDLVSSNGPPWDMLATEIQTRWIPMKSDLWQWGARHGITVGIDDLVDYSQLYQRMLRAKNIDGANHRGAKGHRKVDA